MGIFLHLSISKSVTKEEWDAVYQESLELVDAFELCEARKVKVRGIETFCFVRTKERERIRYHDSDDVITWWNCIGDYDSMCCAENYFLPRELKRYYGDDDDNKTKRSHISKDPLSFIVRDKNDDAYDDDNDYYSHGDSFYNLWGGKTQGELYHIYLLAIGCMIESRLGSKAYVYGDITRGQCVNAVEQANKFLKNKIDVPDSCDAKRFIRRIRTLGLSEKDEIAAIDEYYLGKKDAGFGNLMRETFSDTAFDEYWCERFKDKPPGTIAFHEALGDYIIWGFDFEKLCRHICINDEKEAAEFVNAIMESKLHIKDKDCRDYLKINPDNPGPYGIGKLFANFLFRGAANKKIDAFIPIETIRSVLCSGISEKYPVNVNELIDNYLAEEESQKKPEKPVDEMTDEEMGEALKRDASAVYTELVENKTDKLKEYDIYHYDFLKFYQKGDSINPEIEKTLAMILRFGKELLEKPYFARLMKEPSEELCKWMASQAEEGYIMLRDSDWERIYTEITGDKGKFAKYYSLLKIDSGANDVNAFITALLVNPELYERALELDEEIGADD